MSLQHTNVAVIGSVISGTAAAVSWTDIRDELSLIATVVAIVAGLATIWRSFKG